MGPASKITNQVTATSKRAMRLYPPPNTHRPNRSIQKKHWPRQTTEPRKVLLTRIIVGGGQKKTLVENRRGDDGRGRESNRRMGLNLVATGEHLSLSLSLSLRGMCATLDIERACTWGHTCVYRIIPIYPVDTSIPSFFFFFFPLISYLFNPGR